MSELPGDRMGREESGHGGRGRRELGVREAQDRLREKKGDALPGNKQLT